MITANEVFESLRSIAEADTAGAGTDKRRQSWGPALVLGDEILTTLVDLNHPLPEKKVARLWATFAGPDKVTTHLRTAASKLPMPEARVRAFELRLGTDRSGERLLQVKRGGSGQWSVDAHIMRSRFPRSLQRHQADDARKKARDRVQDLNCWVNRATADDDYQWARNELPNAEAALAKCNEAVAEIEADRADYHRRYWAFGDLIKQRVAEVADSPRAQMIAGAHVTGNCAVCGRGLTDPISLERGIGPECFGHIAPDLRAFLAREEAAAA